MMGTMPEVHATFYTLFPSMKLDTYVHSAIDGAANHFEKLRGLLGGPGMRTNWERADIGEEERQRLNDEVNPDLLT